MEQVAVMDSGLSEESPRLLLRRVPAEQPDPLRQDSLRSVATPATREEHRLVERLRQGDQAVFDLLVTRHHDSLIRFAMAYVSDRSIAEEVAQETWIGFLEGLDRFEGRCSIRTWLFSIVIHKAKTCAAKETRYVSLSGTLDDGSEESPADPSRLHGTEQGMDSWAAIPRPWNEETPEEYLLTKEGFAFLDRAIRTLPPTLREALVLRDVEEMESKEICALLKISESNLYVRLHRARMRLHQQVKQYLEKGLMPA